MPLKAITFDFWSTLYQPKTVDYSQRLLRLKESLEQGSQTEFTVEQMEAAVKTARETWSRTWIERHWTMSAAEWLAVILNVLNISLDPKYVTEIQTRLETSVLSNLPTLTPEVEQVLADLATRYRLAIISDTGITPGWVLRQILAQDNLINYFTHLTFSDEIGRSKPHPDAFLTTLNALNVTPAEAAHVGDLLRTDIAGAKGIGMRAIQYIGVSYDNGADPAITIEPDAVIKNHIELKPLLQSW